ncbi:hypothetical protein [Parvibaculum sedimenti]|uniref:hypothetical protein n=1 Tax=Parvibaculum sedimenti TaxID=2608632 RepID=UPI003BB76A7B
MRKRAMLKTEIYLEKSFELWPGLLRFAITGEGAYAALDAGFDAAREVAATLMVDAELIANAGGSLDLLPRGHAGRLASDAMRAMTQAVPTAQPSDLPPLLVALPGAVCDVVAEAMRNAGSCDTVVVSLGDALSFHVEGGAVLPADLSLPLVTGEFLRMLGEGRSGGVALSGAQAHFPTSGVADRVVLQAKSAALASLAAAYMADGMTVPGMPRCKERIADPLVARAVEGRPLAGNTGLLAPEAIWDALSGGMKRASLLREKRLLRAAALALKGRGRTLGPIDGNRLLRFGVSEWR